MSLLFVCVFYWLMEEIRDEIDTGNDSPIEQVRLTVPVTDDPTLPVITFRTWILGPLICSFAAYLGQYSSYRQNSVYIPVKAMKLLLLPLGKFMAATLPTKAVRVPGTNWKFSMNPGPFNLKEHVLISIFVSSGTESPLSLRAFVVSKIFYHKALNKWLNLLLTLTTQVSGYGFAGIFMHFLVSSPYMWWPSCLVDVALYRALHETEDRSKGHLSRFQFFILVTVSSFAYYVVPNYFFPSIAALSAVCWFWKHSVLAQIIGSGRFGLGIGSVSIDWSSISGTFGNPLAAPTSAIVNTMVGFVLFLYIIAPVSYWSNTFNAKRFPFSSFNMLDFDGQAYNISRVVNETDLTLQPNEYENYSKVFMSTVSLYSNGFTFAAYTALLTDFILFHARDAWNQFTQMSKRGKDQFVDVHYRLMKKYNSIPQWWFFSILISMIGLAVFTCEGFGKQLQLPYWCVLLAYFMVFILILPVGVIQATTGQTFSLDLISEMIIGYAYPGKPLGNMIFRAYGFSTMDHALGFIYDFKLGHYMKIPPKSMFIIQVLGTILSCIVNFATALWILSHVDNVCDITKLPVGSQWTCPSQRSGFNGSIVWGLVGPSRVFAPYGLYSRIYYFFLLGVIASMVVWMLLRLFPRAKWLRSISVPVILGSPIGMEYSGPVYVWTAFVVAMFFNLFVYKRYRGWWAKYNYLLASGLDFGVIIMTALSSMALDVYGVNWWGLDFGDHCPLAQCPTAPGVQANGCPVV